MKGIILAGGRGTRMDPLTRVLNKHLLPVYNKPVIYYPLSTLISMGVTKVLVITGGDFVEQFSKLLNILEIGVEFEFRVQDEPRGLPDAFIVGESFIDSDPVALALGDNLFWGPRLQATLDTADPFTEGARIFTRRVEDPRHFGVLVRDENGEPINIVEKPTKPISHEAVTGLYLFDNKVVEFARELSPSARGELEITDVIKRYLSLRQLACVELGSGDEGFEWYDAGTPDNLVLAAGLIRGAEHDGLLVGSPEAAAFNKGLIDAKHLEKLADGIGHDSYARNLRSLILKQGKDS